MNSKHNKHSSASANDKQKMSKKKLAVNITVLCFSIIFLVAGIVCVNADSLLGKMNYVADPESSTPISTSSSASSDDSTSKNAGLLGGLYHDDAIFNVLLMGVDDYQANDIGRSDSMMLVSVDTRHQKLKICSFMRDMYVAIPGKSSNRLNAAYPFGGGGADGARLTVSTIEANFGIDIDRFVIISNSAFDEIIEQLGGVDITLTQAEADLINKNSGDPRKNLSAGTYTLSGKQAHYYSRIRAIGSDFQRTERQRTVFTSIVNKFKGSDLGTIYNTLNNVLNLFTTNMTKNEILGMAANSLTLLNYPIEQLRVPMDGAYQSTYVGKAAVLLPDLDACREAIAEFIYEDDLPTQSYPSN